MGDRRTDKLDTDYSAFRATESSNLFLDQYGLESFDNDFRRALEPLLSEMNKRLSKYSKILPEGTTDLFQEYYSNSAIQIFAIQPNYIDGLGERDLFKVDFNKGRAIIFINEEALVYQAQRVAPLIAKGIAYAYIKLLSYNNNQDYILNIERNRNSFEPKAINTGVSTSVLEAAINHARNHIAKSAVMTLAKEICRVNFLNSFVQSNSTEEVVTKKRIDINTAVINRMIKEKSLGPIDTYISEIILQNIPVHLINLRVVELLIQTGDIFQFRDKVRAALDIESKEILDAFIHDDVINVIIGTTLPIINTIKK